MPTSQSNQASSPPKPWNDWNEVRKVREALQKYRFLFVKQPGHLKPEEKSRIAELLNSPIGIRLQIPYSFMKDWYSFWKDSDGHRRSLAEAQTCYRAWQDCKTYQQFKSLHHVLERITPERFEQISHFLSNERWEATNNGAERTGRDFRHHQAPHFNLRTKESIAGQITMSAMRQMERVQTKPMETLALPTRGRRSLQDEYLLK